jgi:soluble lytic murein transglycosylase-like protein
MKHDALIDKLAAALIAAESSGNANAVSDKGARGTWQIMPSTWKEWAPKAKVDVSKPFDPVACEKVGRMYLGWLLDQFGGDPQLALAAYNHGIKNVKEKQAKHGKRFQDIVPMLPKQTQNYIAKILLNSNLA